MTIRALAKPKNKNSTTFSPIFGKKSSGRSFMPQPANESHSVESPGFAHNFGDILVESGQSFKQSCPLALSDPAHCPFGGVCHTCPPTIQTKLKIGQPNDKYEQEADRVADEVMRMPEPQAKQKTGVSGRTQTPYMNLQRRATHQAVTSPVPPIVHEVLRSSGQPLDPVTRSSMESHFKHNFNRVCIHSDPKATQSAQSIGAKAFTFGRGIVFGAGQYSPETKSGRGLLVHELTHVIQQEGMHARIQMAPNLRSGDYLKIAEQIHDAIEGLGTDEEAVYHALQKLELNPNPIDKLKKLYEDKYEETLEAAIRGDFSGEELQLALNLIGVSYDGEPSVIEQTPASDDEYKTSARRLYSAMKGMGTDEEAIYATLIPLKNDRTKQNKLKAVYSSEYGGGLYGKSLEDDIRNEMSGNELSYAIYLLNAPVSVLTSPRFKEHPLFQNVLINRVVIEKGDSGLEVTIIQQALLDAGQSLPVNGVSGDFTSETKTAVENFQRDQGMLGDEVDGVVDETTIGLLDLYFLDYTHMAKIAKAQVPSVMPTQGVEWAPGTTPPELLSGTRTLKGGERAAIEYLRTTEVKAPPGKKLPDFQTDIRTHPDSYKKRVEDKTNDIITWLYSELAAGKAAARAIPANLYGWGLIENVALEAKKETDKVFRNYATGNPFTAGTNLFDAWVDKESKFAGGGAAYEQGSVEWRVNKIFGGSTIRDIDEEHGAVQSRPAEEAILDGIRTRIIAARRAELIEIHKGWRGYADPTTSSVFLQRYVSADPTKNRDFMWDTFQTMVHEYIHTLEHSRSRAYRATFGELKGGKTYREGMTEYFTKIVLDSVNYNDALRTSVEGSYHVPGVVHTIPRYFGYAEAANAEAVVGVVGIRNAMAAFFLGKVELIGKL